MMKQCLRWFALVVLPIFVQAQPTKDWNGKSSAVVLTYDDGLDVHLSTVVPALDGAGLKGTFYVSDYAGRLRHQLEGWRKAAAGGHELGNHTVWHPCEGGRTGRTFVQGDYDLRFYTARRLTDEIRTMNNLLQALDRKTERTFAFPCGDTALHDTAYIEPLRKDFAAARGVRPGLVTAGSANLYNVDSYMINGQSGEELIALVRQAMEKRALVVFLFHGVDGGHGLNVSLEAHRQLLQFLKEQKATVWTTTMLDAAKYIKQKQKRD